MLKWRIYQVITKNGVRVGSEVLQSKIYSTVDQSKFTKLRIFLLHSYLTSKKVLASHDMLEWRNDCFEEASFDDETEVDLLAEFGINTYCSKGFNFGSSVCYPDETGEYLKKLIPSESKISYKFVVPKGLSPFVRIDSDFTATERKRLTFEHKNENVVALVIKLLCPVWYVWRQRTSHLTSNTIQCLLSSWRTNRWSQTNCLNWSKANFVLIGANSRLQNLFLDCTAQNHLVHVQSRVIL